MSKRRLISRAKTRERTVVRALTRRLEALGFVVKKNHGSQTSGAGWPDLEVTGNSRICYVEVKATPSDQPTRLQRVISVRLIRAGSPVLLCRGMGDLDRAVDQVRLNLTDPDSFLTDLNEFQKLDPTEVAEIKETAKANSKV